MGKGRIGRIRAGMEAKPEEEPPYPPAGRGVTYARGVMLRMGIFFLVF